MIRESVRGPDLVTLKSGKKATWGSRQHVRDLELHLADLRRIRNYQPRKSVSRHQYQQAINATSNQLRAAKRYSEKLRPPKEVDIEAMDMPPESD